MNTFLGVPYLEDPLRVGEHEVAVAGAPLDTGAAHRPGPRYGPQGMRRASSRSAPADTALRDRLDIVDVGDVFIAPADTAKAFDQITKAVQHIVSNGVFPVILGGDHSIGFATARGVTNALGERIGVIHFDRHLSAGGSGSSDRPPAVQGCWAAHEVHFDAGNLVQIGARQAPTDDARASGGGGLVITVADVEERGLEAVADVALEAAWAGGARGVFLSFDVDVVDPGFAPGTAWPEPGGLTPREVLRLVRRFAAEGLAGMEVVEVCPPYDSSDVTSLLGVRLVCEVLTASADAGHLGRARP
ncbi:agmatinase family protein [Spongiactinospora sp. TRM90649]|uniref:agmatinase family protein n=1 Tax=Spongiactinospora sp. TRM90649 TaxID=3031114 RepID=UPI0023F8C626|nr:agmatinase family protein [Spongiactinospora sp. TRM90649]MDF5752294.1 agmatinase family protein [Spongiactinospora sp. TRM90649]